jgi:hypothetical protein
VVSMVLLEFAGPGTGERSAKIGCPGGPTSARALLPGPRTAGGGEQTGGHPPPPPEGGDDSEGGSVSSPPLEPACWCSSH